MKETLNEVAVKEKRSGSSFLAFHACNGQPEWLIALGLGVICSNSYVLR